MKEIAIIGTGYVGLVSGAGLAEFGNKVTCIDIDVNKINKLNSGEIPIYEPNLKSLINKNCNDGRLFFSSEIEKEIKNSKIIFIAVGTPTGSNGKADLRAVEKVATSIAQNLNEYKIICTKSTVPVGTGEYIKDYKV